MLVPGPKREEAGPCQLSAAQNIFLSYYWHTLLVVFFPEAILAHPMGNFSISHYSKIQIDPQVIQLLYIIDTAEIPTFQEMNVIDGNGNGQIEVPEKDRYLARKVEDLTWNLSLRLNGRKISFQRMSQSLDLIPGGYNLPTMKITLRLSRRDFPRLLR